MRRSNEKGNGAEKRKWKETSSQKKRKTETEVPTQVP